MIKLIYEDKNGIIRLYTVEQLIYIILAKENKLLIEKIIRQFHIYEKVNLYKKHKIF